MTSVIKQLRSRDEYSIGWIVTLSIELASAKVMLDEVHKEPPDYKRHEKDSNSYTYGRIGNHNVVIASLASGVTGNTSATTTALGMVSSFPNIKFGLLVGIGGGIPSDEKDIRLGDVAVSQPQGRSGGVFQHDFGKHEIEGRWTRTDYLARPPEVLLKALNTLQSEHELEDAKMHEYLKNAFASHPKWAKNYCCPGSQTDHLYQPTYAHQNEKHPCTTGCDDSQLILRSQRETSNPEIHYGAIGSGNALVKDGETRDKIAAMEPACICLEMEAAGLMNNFPCIVIRGISDYADSHKSDTWQRYASATSAAFAKELLSYIEPQEVDATARAQNLVENTNEALVEIKKQWEQSNREKQEEKRGAFLKSLADSCCDYTAGKDIHEDRVEGTCEWFINHSGFKSWQEGHDSGLLWLTADPGCGKSVLAKYLIETVLPIAKPAASICYFFFNNESYDQQSASGALCALLHQLFKYRPSIKEEILHDFHSQGSSFTQSLSMLWNTLLSATSVSTDGEVICVLDSVDVCHDRDRRELLSKLNQFGSQSGSSSNLKFIVLSRPYSAMSVAFQEVEQKFPSVHVRGDGEEERMSISQEIDLVTKLRIRQLSETKALHNRDEELLLEKLVPLPGLNYNYIWTKTILDEIEEPLDVSSEMIQNVLSAIPAGLGTLYEQMLEKSPARALARKLFQIMLAARRPLSVREVSIFLNISAAHNAYTDLAKFLQAESREDRMRTNLREISGLLVKIVDSEVHLIHPTVRDFLLQQDPRRSSMSSMDRLSSGFGRVEKIANMFSDRVMQGTSTLAANLGRTSVPQSPPRSNSYFSYASEEGQASKTRHLFARHNSGDKESLAYRNPSISVTTSPALSTPATFSDNDTMTNLSMSMNELHVKTIERIDVASSHAVLAEMCGLWLEMSSEEDAYPELDRYCKASLFPHLFMADASASPDQIRATIRLLDTKLRIYWNLILRHMPNFDKDSADYCPLPDAPLLDLLIFLGIRPLVSSELSRSLKPSQQGGGVYPQLCIAAARGDTQMMDLLFEHYNVNLKMTNDATPLHAAAQCGKVDAVRVLAQKQAFLEAKMKDGSRPLHVAVKHGRAAVVQFLLDYGAEIESKPGESGLTSLNQAIQIGNLEIVNILLEKGAHFTTAGNGHLLPLQRAVGLESPEILAALLAKGADIEQKDANGSRALHFAALNGRTANVKFLLSEHADFDAVNAFQISPVTSAIRGNKSETLKVLIDHSARCSLLDFQFAFQPMVQRDKIWQPRTEWAGTVNTEVMAILLEVANRLSENSLQRFLCQDDIILDAHAVSKILDSGAKASVSSLIAALQRDLLYQRYKTWSNTGSNVVETILERLDTDVVGLADRKRLATVALQGQKPSRFLQLMRKNLIRVGELDKQERKQPYLFAAMEGDFKIVKASLDNLVAIDEQDEQERTALSYALAFGMKHKDDTAPILLYERQDEYVSIANLLLQRGADVSIPDKDGLTPLQWAMLAGNESVEKLVEVYCFETPSVMAEQVEAQLEGDEETAGTLAGSMPIPKRPKLKSISSSQSGHGLKKMSALGIEITKDLGKKSTYKDMGEGIGKIGKDLGKDLGRMGKDFGKVAGMNKAFGKVKAFGSRKEKV